jgi:hypothetical protein
LLQDCLRECACMPDRSNQRFSCFTNLFCQSDIELCRSNTPSVVDLLLSEFYDLLLRCIYIWRLSCWCDHIRYSSASLYTSHTAWLRNQETVPHFPGSESWNFCELNRKSFGDVRWPEHRVWGYRITQNTCCSWHKVAAVLHRLRTTPL